MSANSKNVTQTNDNQAALAKQQQQTQAQLITAQQANDATINADLGTSNHVPAPTAHPSVSAVMGPGESAILSSLALGNIGTSETEAAAAVDPNETGILATFLHSAEQSQAGITANRADTLESIVSGSAASQLAMAQEAGGGGQGIANPLGTQISSVPAYSDTSTPSSSSSGGVSPVLIVGAIACAGGGLWWYEKHRKPAA
jgi:hypothetical protein